MIKVRFTYQLKTPSIDSVETYTKEFDTLNGAHAEIRRVRKEGLWVGVSEIIMPQCVLNVFIKEVEDEPSV